MRPKPSIALEAPAEAALVAPMELAVIPALTGTNARYQELGPGSSSDEAMEAIDRLLQLHVHIVNASRIPPDPPDPRDCPSMVTGEEALRSSALDLELWSLGSRSWVAASRVPW